MKTMISRRSFLCAAGIASASAVLTACGGSSGSTASSTASSAAASSEAASGESVELIVFAAASLTETLNAIAETYSAENPGVTFSFNFDSSGTLKTQIQEGADCDLFISAGQKQMNQLDSTASAEVTPRAWILWMPKAVWICWRTRSCSVCLRAATRGLTASTAWLST